MLKLNFYPESDKIEFIEAAAKYQSIWDNEGGEIVTVIKEVSGLKFKAKFFNALVFEGVSFAYPLRLRASYTEKNKKGALVHELCHKLLMELDNNHLRKTDLEQHKGLYLILYDIWSKLYGDSFAKYNVKIESERRPSYKEA